MISFKPLIATNFTGTDVLFSLFTFPQVPYQTKEASLQCEVVLWFWRKARKEICLILHQISSALGVYL